MKFLADESFPKLSVTKLRNNSFEVAYILESSPGIPDKQVIQTAKNLDAIILTMDSDFGELIFKHGMIPPNGVVYFRLSKFQPDEPAEILIKLLKTGFTTESSLTVIDDDNIRQRKY